MALVLTHTGTSVFHGIMSKYNAEAKGALPTAAAETFSLGCAGATHPAAHRFSTHWTGDIFNNDLGASVKVMITAGYETFTPYTHPDCTGHHGADDDEVYLRWIQFCSMGNVM
jgi:alpha-glucosidase (family GH31 glycosyl hydrolase)